MNLYRHAQVLVRYALLEEVDDAERVKLHHIGDKLIELSFCCTTREHHRELVRPFVEELHRRALPGGLLAQAYKDFFGPNAEFGS